MNPKARSGRLFLLFLIAFPALARTEAPAPATSVCHPFTTPAEAELFLGTARITGSSGINVGVTLPEKLTLDDGKTRHAALFKSIDERKSGLTQIGSAAEMDFKDSWKYEVAAYELDKLLDLRMIPVTVERIFAGRKGSLQLWLDGCMVERDRAKTKLQPPDASLWNHQIYKVRVFDNLVYNIDRNLGNLLISADWKLFMIDHSRTFKSVDQLKAPQQLTYFSRSMIEKMRLLDRETLRQRCGKYLSGMEIDTLLKRRDRLVKLFEHQLSASGEAIAYP